MTEQAPWQQAAPQPQPQQPQPKKKHRKWPWITLGILVVLIVIISTTSHSSNTPSTSTPAGATATQQPAAPVAATTVAPTTTPAPTVVYSKTGSGTGTTPNFTVGAEWQIDWTYNCSNFGGSGNFIITPVGSGGTGIGLNPVNELGASGADTAYEHDAAGTFNLQVNSECNWTVKVIG